jgi:glycogen debranching enzyme
LNRPCPFAIPATDNTPAYTPRVLKQDDTFLVVDLFGDIQAYEAHAEGLFYADTRYMSHLLLIVNGHRPLRLSSNVTEDNLALVIDLTNPDIVAGERVVLPKDTLHVLRTKTLDNGACFERIEVRNYGQEPVDVELVLRFAADFADMFEVRGQVRPQRGRLFPPVLRDDEAVLGYEGLDGVVRQAIFGFDPQPDALQPEGAAYWFGLQAGASRRIEITTRCRLGDEQLAVARNFDDALAKGRGRLERSKPLRADVFTSNVSFNYWVNRSVADIGMLITDKPTGSYVYAGIPWFSTAFGRDGIITAMQCLWYAPYLAEGTLRFLAATQATESDPASDAEPGKILHETRRGEMAMLGEIPFKRYYGSVDSTPLFVMLARAYFDRTGDRTLIEDIWPNIEAALGWMEQYGDLDGDGFLEYKRRAATGLANQGWKDSSDSVFHADGTLAEPPIALCEVQAYAYAAWLGAAALARAIGQGVRANELTAHALVLRRHGEAAFWDSDLGTYVLALDGEKRPCRVRTSNAGHTLFTGIASPDRAARVAATLMDPSSFSQWGIRTVADDAARYNPISYHNGSVWPHDNALIAMGFARYSLMASLSRLVTAMFDASMAIELARLPELFCGFERRPGEGPTSYPVACLPQAWASGTTFAMLGAMLGLSFNPLMRQIRVTRPVLPEFLDEVQVRNLRLGPGSVDLLFRRHTRDVALNVLRKDGDIEVLLVG